MTVLRVILVDGQIESEAEAGCVTPTAIQIQCDNPDNYNDTFHMSYAVSQSAMIVHNEYELQKFYDAECLTPIGEKQCVILSAQNQEFPVSVDANAHYYLRVQGITKLQDGELRGNELVLEVDTRPATAMASILGDGRTVGETTYYNHDIWINVQGFGRNFRLNRLLEANPVAGVSMTGKDDVASGVIAKEGSYEIRFSHFLDAIGHEITIDNSAQIKNVILDKTKPILQVSLPKDVLNYEGDSCQYMKMAGHKKQVITIEAKDSHLDEESVEIKLDGKRMELSKIADGVWVGEIDQGRYHSIQALCHDYAGNMSSWNCNQEMVVDYEAPSGRLVIEQVENPEKAQYLNKSSEASITKVDDNLSGIASVAFYKSGVGAVDPELITRWREQKSILLGKNEKVVVYAKIKDKCGNEFICHSGQLCYDSEKPWIQVDEVAPERAKIYNKDIELKIEVSDPLCNNMNSGVKQSSYEIIKIQGEDRIETDSGSFKETKELRIDARKNNCNRVLLQIHSWDNCGNQRTFHREYAIDRDKPQIQIEFSDTLGRAGRYFRDNRHAMVLIKERNLLEESIQISDGAVKNMKKTEDELYAVEVEFSKEKCYGLEVSCEDIAGNRSVKKVKPFLIDKTKPQIKFSQQENGYTCGFVKGTIQVKDRNVPFNTLPNKMSLGRNRTYRLYWTKKDDSYYANYVLKQDGQYQPSLTVEDLSGNITEKRVKPFVIDTKSPGIQILGVKNHMATNQKVVAPIVQITDEHIDKRRLLVSLSGAKQGNIQKWQVQRKIHIDNLKQDDIYTLSVKAYDKANNLAQRQVVFSINRKGSTYHLSAEASKLEGAYLKSVSEISLQEINLSKVPEDKAEIIIMRNNQETTLSYKDYEREETMTKEGWCEYTYRIHERYLQEEGAYHIGIRSRDEVNNQKNSLSDHQVGLRFVVDHTAPQGIFLNTKSKENIYQQKHNIIMKIDDSMGVESIAVYLDNCKIPFAKKDNLVSFQVNQKNERQNVRVVASDKAGNQSEFLLEHILVTTNVWQQAKSYIILFSMLLGVLIGCVIIYHKVSQGRKNSAK